MSELCEATPGLAQLTAVDRHFRSSSKRALRALEGAAGFVLELGLPPDLPPSHDPAVLMDAWELARGDGHVLKDGPTLRMARSDLESAPDLARWVAQVSVFLRAQASLVIDELHSTG